MSLAEKYIQKHLVTLSKSRSNTDFRPGDTIKVHNKIIDETSERIQIFEGVCIAKTNNKLGSTFRVKKISYGMCFEKVFPDGLHHCRSRQATCGQSSQSRNV